jgi:hypothetical protein
MLASGAAVLLIALLLVRATAGRWEATRRRETLLAALERLSEAQEDALARDGRYASHLAPSGGVDTALFVPTPAMLISFELLGPASWRAVVTDTALRAGPRSCGLFRGEVDASPHRAAVRPGIPACW